MANVQSIFEQAKELTLNGKVAPYIPALAQADPAAFAVKVWSFIVAANHHGIEEIMHYVEVELTGESFHSIVRLESNNKKPFNPMINAGNYNCVIITWEINVRKSQVCNEIYFKNFRRKSIYQ